MKMSVMPLVECPGAGRGLGHSSGGTFERAFHTPALPPLHRHIHQHLHLQRAPKTAFLTHSGERIDDTFNHLPYTFYSISRQIHEMQEKAGSKANLPLNRLPVCAERWAFCLPFEVEIVAVLSVGLHQPCVASASPPLRVGCIFSDFSASFIRNCLLNDVGITFAECNFRSFVRVGEGRMGEGRMSFTILFSISLASLSLAFLFSTIFVAIW